MLSIYGLCQLVAGSELSFYSDLYRELLQKEAEGLKQEAKEKETSWSQEKQQLQLEKDNHTQLIKELQNQLALSRQDTARVRYTFLF